MKELTDSTPHCCNFEHAPFRLIIQLHARRSIYIMNVGSVGFSAISD